MLKLYINDLLSSYPSEDISRLYFAAHQHATLKFLVITCPQKYGVQAWIWSPSLLVSLEKAKLPNADIHQNLNTCPT